MDIKKWTKEELRDWHRFWTSDMGKKALVKIEQLKQHNLEGAMFMSPEYQLAHLNRAAGVEIVIRDIQTGIKLAEEEEK